MSTLRRLQTRHLGHSLVALHDVLAQSPARPQGLELEAIEAHDRSRRGAARDRVCDSRGVPGDLEHRRVAARVGVAGTTSARPASRREAAAGAAGLPCSRRSTSAHRGRPDNAAPLATTASASRQTTRSGRAIRPRARPLTAPTGGVTAGPADGPSTSPVGSPPALVGVSAPAPLSTPAPSGDLSAPAGSYPLILAATHSPTSRWAALRESPRHTASAAAASRCKAFGQERRGAALASPLSSRTAHRARRAPRPEVEDQRDLAPRAGGERRGKLRQRAAARPARAAW